MVLNKRSAADTLQQLAGVITCQAVNVCCRRSLRHEDLLSNLNVLTPKRNKIHEAHPAGNIAEAGVGRETYEGCLNRKPHNAGMDLPEADGVEQKVLLHVL